MVEEYVDAIKEGEIVTMPLSQARKEDLFVLRKKIAVATPAPAPAPTRTSSRQHASEVPARITPKWHSYQSEYKKNNVIMELVNNFHWEVSKARKGINFSRRQLGDAIGESESTIKMIENGELPSDDFIIINKIQNYLKINLRRDGKTFEMPRESLKPVSNKPIYSKDVTLSDLQKMKEAKAKEDKPDIEIIE